MVITGFTACAVGVNASDSMRGASEPFFSIDAGGNLARPDSYREWVYVGTPVTPDELNGGKAPFPEFHNVYIDPISYTHWQQFGQWREGTILIKELVSVGTKRAVSGKGYFMGDFIGLEATIKSQQHFPDEPGNWAYFSFTNPGKDDLKTTAKAFATKSCNACHDASAADDFVFTQYYPVLRAAKGFGMGRPEGSGKVSRHGVAAATKPEVNKKWLPTAPTPDGSLGGIPLGKSDLFGYLKNGGYKSFKNQEAKSHPSDGPHTSLGLPVRVFMNDTVSASLAAGNTSHPKGAGIVKEMFSDKGELSGWAVMVKTQEATDDGKGWLWYEVTSSSDANQIAAMGNGVVGCAQCHSSGDDMVLTQFPLR
ncbi:MAG: cytochrome c553 [Neolewinella sp.]|jgi:cytochrome c553